MPSLKPVNTPKQAVMYARFSPKVDPESASVIPQIQAMRRHCKAKGWRCVAAFADKMQSGAKRDRAGLWRAVHAVPRGGVLLVRTIDRLARDIEIKVLVDIELRRKKATIECVEGGDAETATERMMRGMLLVIAQFQRELSAERTSAAMRRHQANGRAMGGTAPLGLKKVGKSLEIDQSESAAVQLILSERAAGRSYRGIIAALEAAGHQARAGRWHRSSILRTLRRHSA